MVRRGWGGRSLWCIGSPQTEAVALGPNRETSARDDALTRPHAIEDKDVVPRSIAETNITFDEPARLLRIGDVHHRAVSDMLYGCVRYQCRGPTVFSLDVHGGKHSQSKLLSGIRHFDAQLCGPGLGIHLRIDVADLPMQGRIRIRLRRNAGTRTDTDAREIFLIEVGDDPDG